MIITFVFNRFIVKMGIKEDFWHEDTGWLLAVLYISPIIPFLNILILLFVGAFVLIAWVDYHGVDKVAKKIFFIRDNKKDREDDNQDRMNELV